MGAKAWVGELNTAVWRCAVAAAPCWQWTRRSTSRALLASSGWAEWSRRSCARAGPPRHLPHTRPPDVESTPTQAEACKREEAELALAQPAKGTVTRAKGKVCWRFDTLGTYYYSTRVEWVDRGGMVG